MKTLSANYQQFGTSITSYDIAKTIAVFLMIIDHIGLYFYPDQLWFRVFGRMCIPIWFFLIGYSKSQRFDRELLTVAFLMIIIDQFIYHEMLLSILVSMIVVRAINKLFLYKLVLNSQKGMLLALALILFSCNIFASQLIQYGTLGVMLSICGYCIRHDKKSWDTVLFFMLMIPMFWAFQTPDYTMVQYVVVSLGLALVLFGLFHFQPKSFEISKDNALFKVTRWSGRNTLFIYFLHLEAFRVISSLLGVTAE